MRLLAVTLGARRHGGEVQFSRDEHLVYHDAAADTDALSRL